MNQAQALSSVNYRILRTISLKKHFYITDIAYNERGIVCLSVVKQAFLTNEIMGGNDVKIVLPTGSYINYWQKKNYLFRKQYFRILFYFCHLCKNKRFKDT